ncbi:MAG: hypothetical protein JSV91_08400 [Phycisphaerales bacterium]|nr:MAG: hypothetical protein JSV91_08400 [Phycisphaerales bacterium]
MAPATPWWITVITFALAIGGVLLGVWALWWDRSRGRLRCPKCWYDMRGAKAGDGGRFTCPECGRSSLTDGKLRRTRRHWRWAGLAVLMIAGSLAMVAMRRDGPLSLIPSWVLVRLPGGGEIEWLDAELWDKSAANWRVKEIQRRYRYGWDQPAGAMRHWLTRVEDALREEGRWGVSDLTRLTHQRLRNTIVDREFKGLPAADVLEKLGRIAAVPIVPVWQDLERGGDLDTDTTMWFSTRGLSVLSILNHLRDDDGWCRARWTCGPDGVLVGTEATLARMRVVQIYDVDHLIELKSESPFCDSYEPDDELSVWEMCQSVADLIVEYVDIDGWTCMGGDSSAIEQAAWQIIVDTHPANHLAIEDLLQRLRAIAVCGDEARESNELDSLRSKIDRLAAISVPCEQWPMTAAELAALISEFSPFEVAVDWEAMEYWGVEPDDEIAIPRGGASLDQLLQRFIESSAGFPDRTAAWTFCDEQLLLTSDDAARGHARTILYDVTDLVKEVCRTDYMRAEEGVQAIVDLVISLVDADSWWQMGGWASRLQAFGGVLIIRTTPSNHLQIENLLNRLRRILLGDDSGLEQQVLDEWRAEDLDDETTAKYVLYDIGDLLDTPRRAIGDTQLAVAERLNQIIDSIADNVGEPDDWQLLGGETGKILSIGEVLAIQTTPGIHLTVDDYLNTLRK